jgi:hypothetical protein
VALIAGPTRLSPFAGVPSGATVIMDMTLAVAAAGEAMPNETEFEIAPMDESFTVMLTVPGIAMSEADTAAARSALSPKVVLRAVPFHATTEDEVNPLPLTSNVNAPCPAMA